MHAGNDAAPTGPNTSRRNKQNNTRAQRQHVVTVYGALGLFQVWPLEDPAASTLKKVAPRVRHRFSENPEG